VPGKVGRPATGETFIARIRIPWARWSRFARAAKAIGSDRAKVVNELVAWFMREPGAKLPERPPVVEPLPEDGQPPARFA
jgi:hypothetical protein